MVFTHHPLTLGDFHDAYDFFKKEMEQRDAVISNNSVLVPLLFNALGQSAATQLNRANFWATELCAAIGHFYLCTSAVQHLSCWHSRDSNLFAYWLSFGLVHYIDAKRLGAFFN